MLDDHAREVRFESPATTAYPVSGVECVDWVESAFVAPTVLCAVPTSLRLEPIVGPDAKLRVKGELDLRTYALRQHMIRTQAVHVP